MAVKLAIIERLVRAELLTGDLPATIADWPAEWRDEFEERAAIMDREFYGSLARPEAEAWAETIVRALYNVHTKDSRST